MLSGVLHRPDSAYVDVPNLANRRLRVTQLLPSNDRPSAVPPSLLTAPHPNAVSSYAGWEVTGVSWALPGVFGWEVAVHTLSNDVA